MNIHLAKIVASRVEITARALKRHRLVFLQAGSAWEGVRDEIIGELGETRSADGFSEWRHLELDVPLVIADLDPHLHGSSLGAIREAIFELLDRGASVCVVSRSPRVAFPDVPGSSLLEDSALVCFPVIQEGEVDLREDEYPPAGWRFMPALDGPPDRAVLATVVRELGLGMVAALDHALFEVDLKGHQGLQFMTAREIEALRGAGLVEVPENGVPELVAPSLAKDVREVVAELVSESVDPDKALGNVAAGLWFIERRIRMAVRVKAVEQYGTGWRASSVGGLAAEILRRAQLDSSTLAKSVADLRDPLEWLTLGELMEIVRSEKMNNLGTEPAVWRKLQEQLVPVRNRLAHVRILKSGDPEIVAMWSGLVRARLK